MPPTLQPDTISGYSCVAIDTHTTREQPTSRTRHTRTLNRYFGVRCRHPNYNTNSTIITVNTGTKPLRVDHTGADCSLTDGPDKDLGRNMHVPLLRNR